ncbi:MAG: flagellar basal body-associated protein FliL [Burkholderiales bacterium]
MAGKKEPAKNTEAADPAAAPAPGPTKKSKVLKLLAILIIVGGAGGGAAYWYLGQNKNPGTAAEAKPQPAKPPVYVPLEPFTVNLQIEENPQFLQTGLSLKVSDATVVDALKLHMPEVRDRILLLLSSRKASELLTLDGKRKLSNDIVETVNAILSPQAPKVAVATAIAPPPAKPPQEAPPADGEAKPETEAVAATSEDKPEPEAAAPAPKLPILSVLFTSFIVQ